MSLHLGDGIENLICLDEDGKTILWFLRTKVSSQKHQYVRNPMNNDHNNALQRC